MLPGVLGVTDGMNEGTTLAELSFALLVPESKGRYKTWWFISALTAKFKVGVRKESDSAARFKLITFISLMVEPFSFLRWGVGGRVGSFPENESSMQTECRNSSSWGFAGAAAWGGHPLLPSRLGSRWPPPVLWALGAPSSEARLPLLPQTSRQNPQLPWATDLSSGKFTGWSLEPWPPPQGYLHIEGSFFNQYLAPCVSE